MDQVTCKCRDLILKVSCNAAVISLGINLIAVTIVATKSILNGSTCYQAFTLTAHSFQTLPLAILPILFLSFLVVFVVTRIFSSDFSETHKKAQEQFKQSLDEKLFELRMKNTSDLLNVTESLGSNCSRR